MCQGVGWQVQEQILDNRDICVWSGAPVSGHIIGDIHKWYINNVSCATGKLFIRQFHMIANKF